MIFQLSAETGVAPESLASLDHAGLLTLVEEVRERNRRREWSQSVELLAELHELLQLLRIEQQVMHGVKRGDLSEFHRIPRPGDPVEDDKPKRDVLSPRQFALMTAAEG